MVCLIHIDTCNRSGCRKMFLWFFTVMTSTKWEYLSSSSSSFFCVCVDVTLMIRMDISRPWWSTFSFPSLSFGLFSIGSEALSSHVDSTCTSNNKPPEQKKCLLCVYFYLFKVCWIREGEGRSWQADSTYLWISSASVCVYAFKEKEKNLVFLLLDKRVDFCSKMIAMIWHVYAWWMRQL